MNIYTNMNNGPVRPAAEEQRPNFGGVSGAAPTAHCLGEPIAAGTAATAMGGMEEDGSEDRAQPEGTCGGPCHQSVAFCETLTLHESFDASGITEDCARIAYDTSFLGYTVEELTMSATLPCGGCCPVPVQRVSLTGAIPYVISVGPVESGCGCPVDLSIQGSAMVDEVVGYACSSTEPDLNAVTCCNVTPWIRVNVKPCGCSDKTNITVFGKFNFHDLPPLM